MELYKKFWDLVELSSGIETETLKLDMTFEQAKLDDLDTIDIMLVFEDKLGIEFPDTDLNLYDFDTFEELFQRTEQLVLAKDA